MPSKSFRTLAVVAIAYSVVGCGGSQSAAPIATTPHFVAATNSECVQAETKAQTVALPATGGVTGTISFGAFASATGCENVTVATGADAAASTSVQQADRRFAQADQSSTAPILSITVGQGFGLPGSSYVGVSIFQGAVLNTTVTPKLPDGTYYATITQTNATGSVILTTLISFTCIDGQLSVTPSKTNQLPFAIKASDADVITIYPKGVYPSLATPTPTPGPSTSPSATNAPTAQPTVVPTSKPTPQPTPTQDPSASPTPANADFVFNEGAFTPACYPASCEFNLISTMNITTTTYNSTLSVQGTYVSPGQSNDSPYNDSAVYSDQLLSVDTKNGDPLTIVPEGSLVEAIISNCDSTDDAYCGNSTGGETSHRLYFDNQADENTFNAEFAAFRADTGSYNFLSGPRKLDLRGPGIGSGLHR